jgi:ADP-ribose pyrophosphatase
MPVPLPENAKRVHKGPIFEIWQWQQQLFDGASSLHERVVRQDTAAVIAFLDKDTILLTQQEQSGRTPFVDVPGGRVEPNESALEAAGRELTEETGYHAGVLEPFRSVELTGTIRYARHVLLGKQLTLDPSSKNLEGGERIKNLPTSWGDAVQMSLKGELRGDTVMLAILAMEFDPEARKIKERFLQS